MPFKIISTKRRKKFEICKCLTTFGLLVGILFITSCTKPENVFMVGHSYGKRAGTWEGMSPELMNFLKLKLTIGDINNKDPYFFLGDMVKHGDQNSSWSTALSQLDRLKLTYYFVMGNHDFSSNSIKLFRKKWGGAFYKTENKNADFVILNGMEDRGKISPQQVTFLRETIKNSSKKIIFILFHELIWVHGRSEYDDVIHNYGNYEQVFKYSPNFWEEIYPIIKEEKDKIFIVVNGDVSANMNAKAFVLRRKENLTLLATGVGDNQLQNILKFSIWKSKVQVEVLPLNPVVPKQYYSISL